MSRARDPRPRGDGGPVGLDAARPDRLRALLPIGGAIVFLPPLLTVFDRKVTLFGVPLILLYLLAIWLAGIWLTRHVSRAMVRDEDGRPDHPSEEVPAREPDWSSGADRVARGATEGHGHV